MEATSAPSATAPEKERRSPSAFPCDTTPHAFATSSAQEALEAVRSRMPDVLVSDIGMPGEDGYSLVRKVMAHAAACKRPAPRAIAVTAFAMGEDRAHALRAGYHAHLTKLVDTKELALTIAKLARARAIS